MKVKKYGLIGKKLTHSFSPSFFADKFNELHITDCQYDAYELPSIEHVTQLMSEPLEGFNVTLPYKEAIIPYLDNLSPEASAIRAVNCVKREKNNTWKGYNTDALGFEKSLLDFLGEDKVSKALVFGTGGASKAIQYVLKKHDIRIKVVSRSSGDVTYDNLDDETLKNYTLLINTTPLGMYPNVDTCPSINYDLLSPKYFLYDLTYNPEKTLFLTKGKLQHSKIKNGYDMLVLQAEFSWKIWTNQK